MKRKKEEGKEKSKGRIKKAMISQNFLAPPYKKAKED
jgi:hypothetical protein